MRPPDERPVTRGNGDGRSAHDAFRCRRRGGVAKWSGLCCARRAVPLPFSAAAGPLQAHGFKMAGDALRVRIVLQFDREPDPKWFLLRSPHRLVVDLPQTEFAVDPRELKPRGLVSDVRFGDIGEGRRG